MFLPFSLKVGHITLDITNFPEREDKKMTDLKRYLLYMVQN